MKRALRYGMILLLVFQCGSGMAFSRTESIAHEWAGLVLFAVILVHLILNRRWFGNLFRGKYNPARSISAAADAALILAVILIAVSGMVISGYAFSPLICPVRPGGETFISFQPPGCFFYAVFITGRISAKGRGMSRSTYRERSELWR